MSDYDPNRDYRDPASYRELRRSDIGAARSSWAWILGGLAAFVLIILALSVGRDDTQTATSPGVTATPPATTGAAPPRTPPAPAAPNQNQ